MFWASTQDLVICRSRRHDAVEALTTDSYTWPSAAACAFGCVDILLWDRRLDLAMFVYTQCALQGVRPLLVGERSQHCTKTDVTDQHRSVFRLHQGSSYNKNEECKRVPCLYTQMSIGTALT